MNTSTNKKVKNATVVDYNNLTFKSEFEAKCYKLLVEAGLNPSYENFTIVLQEGFYPKTPFYEPYKLRTKQFKGKKVFDTNPYKVLAITYTPDFVVEYNNNKFIIEAKGFTTDRYAIIVKLFRKWMDDNMPDAKCFEVHTQKELKEAIRIIKES